MRFLRFFPQYRALEAELADTASRLIAAQDQERLWRSRCEIAEERRDKAEANADRNHKMIANYLALSAGQPAVPYPEVFVPMPEPERPETEPEARRRQARDVVREADAEFARKYGEMLKRQEQQNAQ